MAARIDEGCVGHAVRCERAWGNVGTWYAGCSRATRAFPRYVKRTAWHCPLQSRSSRLHSESTGLQNAVRTVEFQAQERRCCRPRTDIQLCGDLSTESIGVLPSLGGAA